MDDGGGASGRKRGRKKNHQRRKGLAAETEIPDGRDYFSDLPDECTQTILGFLSSSRDRCACAAVCKRWLLLLAQIRGSHFNAFRVTAARTDTVVGNGDGIRKADGVIRVGSNAEQRKAEEACRCLEAKEANDARLAAMAVGTYARRLLGKLSVRGGGFQQRITDLGLHIVSQSFPNLRALSLWDCFKVGSVGLASVAECCRRLEKLDISNLPRIDDDGLVPIAKNCPNLSTLAVDACPLVGNRALRAIARCSSHLRSISVSKCPLVGDAGIICVVSELPKLAKVRLARLKLSNAALHAIGEHRSSIRMLVLDNLTGISMSGLADKPEFLSVNNCADLTDAVLVGVTRRRLISFACLKNVGIKKCEHLTDVGLSTLTGLTDLLHTLKVERCDSVTADGILGALRNCRRTLRVLSIVECASIDGAAAAHGGGDDDGVVGYPMLESITVKNCAGIDDAFLTMLAPTLVHADHVALMGLAAVTDRGLCSLLKHVTVTPGRRPASVSLSGCLGITDRSVQVLAGAFNRRLHSLSLDGCHGLGDRSLEAIGDLCPGLAELDVSGCERISDGGVVRLAAAAHQRLEVLSLAGCHGITDGTLSCLQVMCCGLDGLNLQRCRGVSREGVDSLRATLWWCDLLY